MKLQLTPKSHLTLFTQAIREEDGDVSTLMELKPPHRDQIQMYGKKIDLPRFQALYGNSSYTYSRIKLEPISDIPVLVQKCIQFANNEYPSHVWGGALVNWYMDGTDYVSMHSDDETDLSPGAPILSFSFGAERTFRVETKIQGGAVTKMDFVTLHNSCIVMEGEIQKEFSHGITKTLKPTRPRINITVRSFKPKTVPKKARVAEEGEKETL